MYHYICPVVNLIGNEAVLPFDTRVIKKPSSFSNERVCRGREEQMAHMRPSLHRIDLLVFLGDLLLTEREE